MTGLRELTIFWHTLLHAGRNLLPIMLVVAAFQVFVLQSVPEGLTGILLGLGIVVFGIALFLQGLEMGIFPIGRSLSNAFARRGSLPLLLGFGFSFGFAAVIAEPALIAVANQAETISAFCFSVLQKLAGQVIVAEHLFNRGRQFGKISRFFAGRLHFDQILFSLGLIFKVSNRCGNNILLVDIAVRNFKLLLINTAGPLFILEVGSDQVGELQAVVDEGHLFLSIDEKLAAIRFVAGGLHHLMTEVPQRGRFFGFLFTADIFVVECGVLFTLFFLQGDVVFPLLV